MFLSQDGSIGDFCCEKMEYHSLKPEKCISFDFSYKKVWSDKETEKAMIMSMEKGGIAVDQGFASERSGPAGYSMVPIDFCPWCSKKIEFT